MAEGEVKQLTDGIGATLADASEPTWSPCFSEIAEVKAKCYWVQCKEYLCEECVRFHQKLTVTKSHTLRDAEHAIPTDVCEANEEGLSVKMGSRDCQIHPGQAVERFCTTHRVLCCSMCLEDDHNSCKSEQISTASKGYAKSEELHGLNGKLIALKTSIHYIINRKHEKDKYDVETCLNGSIFRLKTVAEDILRSHIDTAASTVKERIIEGMTSSEEELQNILKDIQKLQVSLDSKSDDEEELFIRAYRENSNLRRFEDFINSCSGKLTTSWILSFSPDHETILSKYVSLKPTTTTALRVKQPMESNCSTTDIECLSDGRFVLVDSMNKALKFFKGNNKYQSTHCLQMRPLNVVEVEPGRLVVIFPKEKTIRFVHVADTLTDECSVQVDDTPTGLATFDGKIFVSFKTHLRILGRDGNIIERISKDRNGEYLFLTLTCIMINDKMGRLYAVDEGRLAFIHVDSIRQMETRSSSAVLLSQDGKFKPSMTFDEDNSLYVCTPESIKHFNPDLVELQIFQYTEFYTPIRLSDSSSAKDSETAAATTATVSAGSVSGFNFGSTGKTSVFGKPAGTLFGSCSNTMFGAHAPAPSGLFGNASADTPSSFSPSFSLNTPAVNTAEDKGYFLVKTSDSSRAKPPNSPFSSSTPALTAKVNGLNLGNTSDSSRDKQATTPNQHVVTFPKFAMCCRKSVGQLLICGESDQLSIVHIG